MTSNESDVMLNDTWWQGASYIRNSVIASLQTDLPPIFAQMKQQWGVADADLPYIDTFEPEEPRAFISGVTGLVCMSLPATESAQVVALDDACNEQFQVRYNCRLYGFVRSATPDPGDESGYQRISRIRDMTAAATRAGLLYTPSFHQPDLELVSGSLTESYSDIEAGKGDRWVAAYFQEFMVKADEDSVRPVYGTVQTTHTDVTIITSTG